jgi:hypothetical protein
MRGSPDRGKWWRSDLGMWHGQHKKNWHLTTHNTCGLMGGCSSIAKSLLHQCQITARVARISGSNEKELWSRFPSKLLVIQTKTIGTNINNINNINNWLCTRVALLGCGWPHPVLSFTEFQSVRTGQWDGQGG